MTFNMGRACILGRRGLLIKANLDRADLRGKESKSLLVATDTKVNSTMVKQMGKGFLPGLRENNTKAILLMINSVGKEICDFPMETNMMEIL
jgi:hypothetical protein